MSKITASPDMSQLKPEFDELQKFIDIFCQDVADTVNGKLDFAQNFNAKEVSFSFTAANADTAVAHSLGRVPSRYILTSASAAMSLYSGTTASTSSTMYLKSSAIGTATVLIY